MPATCGGACRRSPFDQRLLPPAGFVIKAANTPTDRTMARGGRPHGSSCMAMSPRRKVTPGVIFPFPHPKQVGRPVCPAAVQWTPLSTVVLAPAAIGLMCIAVASFAQMRRH
jgi:hypothetical protein